MILVVTNKQSLFLLRELKKNIDIVNLHLVPGFSSRFQKMKVQPKGKPPSPTQNESKKEGKEKRKEKKEDEKKIISIAVLTVMKNRNDTTIDNNHNSIYNNDNNNTNNCIDKDENDNITSYPVVCMIRPATTLVQNNIIYPIKRRIL